MPKTSLFETQLRLVTEYVIDMGEEMDGDEYIQPGTIYTMNYTHTRNYTSEDASIKVTVVSVGAVIDDDWPVVSILGCILKTDIPIYICEYGAYLARGITLHTDTTTIASGHVSKVKVIEPF